MSKKFFIVMACVFTATGLVAVAANFYGYGGYGPSSSATASKPAGSFAIEERPPTRSDAPNIVLLLGCSIRKDQITPYGGLAETTPFLQELADAGARFEDVVGASSWTRATTAAMITGLHPLSLGLPEPKPSRSKRILPDDAVTLAERLADEGYFTIGVTRNPNLNSEFGMAQGFDVYDDSTDGSFAKRKISYGGDAVAVAMKLLDARGAAAGRPFYLQIMLIDAHSPWRPSATQLQRFEGPEVTQKLAKYRAMVHQFDDAARLLDSELAGRGYDESNTLFVFVTDHGEGLALPVHHNIGYGKTMYPTTTNTAWILRGPGIEPATVVRGLVSQVDVFPTLLGLVGAKTSADLPGRDWSSLVRDGGGQTDRSVAFSSSWFHGANVASVWTREHQCQRDYGSVDEIKYPIHDACYDRAQDPDFVRPIEDAQLMLQLEEWRSLRLEEFKRREHSEATVGSDTEAQLRALGYVK